MTEFQNTLYWRRWSAMLHANGWSWLKNRTITQASKERSEHHVRVWELAGIRAAQHHRAPTADDVRHACHIYALGKDMSHLDMPNSAFSRLLCLWGDGKKKLGLLVEPLCLESLMHWNDRRMDAREGVVAQLRKFPEALVRSQADRQFGSRAWESLQPDQQLKILMTLKTWARNQRNKPSGYKRPDPPKKLQYVKGPY